MVPKYMHQRCYRGDFYDYQTAIDMIDRMRDIEKDNKEHPEKVFELM